MIELQAADASLNVTLSAIKKSIKSGVQGEAYTDTTRQLKSQILGIKARMDLASKTLSTGSPEQQRIAATFAAASKTYTDELGRVEKEAENRTLSMTLDRESMRVAMMSRLSGMRERLTNLRKDNLQLVSMQLEQRELTNDLDRAEQQLRPAAWAVPAGERPAKTADHQDDRTVHRDPDQVQHRGQKHDAHSFERSLGKVPQMVLPRA